MITVEQMNQRKKYLGYTYEKISEISGVPLSTVQKVLSGITQNPRRETLEALSDALGPMQEPARYIDADCACEAQAAYSIYGSLASGVRQYIPWKPQGKYTVDDLDLLPEDVRAEIIDGVIYGMAAPTIRHQEILMEITFQVQSFIKSNKGACKVFVAPLDVHIGDTPEKEDRHNSVQPDILIVCDQSKNRVKHYSGAPDFIAEILSPSTSKKDKAEKYRKYKETGVREYWVVDPDACMVMTFDFENDKIGYYPFSEPIPVAIYQAKLQIDLGSLIPEETEE